MVVQRFSRILEYQVEIMNYLRSLSVDYIATTSVSFRFDTFHLHNCFHYFYFYTEMLLLHDTTSPMTSVFCCSRDIKFAGEVWRNGLSTINDTWKVSFIYCVLLFMEITFSLLHAFLLSPFRY